MDPEAFPGSFFKWDPRGVVAPGQARLMEAASAMASSSSLPTATTSTMALRPRELGGIDELFQAYGVRYYTATKISELGFTVQTLLGMKDEELEEMMNSLSQIFRWELLVGERYGIKAAVRAERRKLDEEDLRRRCLPSAETANAIDALSQEGLSEVPMHHLKEAAGSGGGAAWDSVSGKKKPKQQQRRNRKKGQRKFVEMDDDDMNDENEGNDDDDCNIGGYERQREHPFIVTEPGEVARGKKNGLDYLFHLYEQCREFLIQVQNIAKEHGEKCPTKVTNQVFRYAKKAGASYINKPKMRHYVHCYALHCLDEEASNALRRAFKERGENVGAWRKACYEPLVAIAARQGWDIDAIFNVHPRLSIWYVPTMLRQRCHAERHAVAAASGSVVTCASDHLPF